MHKTILVMTIICIFAIIQHQTKQAITYFPPNDRYFFEHANVDLIQENNQINWVIESKTNERAYIRQDVGLLYTNGKFISFYNDWKTDTDHLQFQTSIHMDNRMGIDAISIHYAEFHEDAHIYSIEKIVSTSTSGSSQGNHSEHNQRLDEYLSFKTAYEKEIINHFSFDDLQYDFVLLNELPAYITNQQTKWSAEQIETVIGHLAESIYKQYVTKLLTHHGHYKHRIPVILFDKNEPFIFIVFQLDGEWYQYKQQIPFSQTE